MDKEIDEPPSVHKQIFLLNEQIEKIRSKPLTSDDIKKIHNLGLKIVELERAFFNKRN